MQGGCHGYAPLSLADRRKFQGAPAGGVSRRVHRRDADVRYRTPPASSLGHGSLMSWPISAAARAREYRRTSSRPPVSGSATAAPWRRAPAVSGARLFPMLPGMG